MARMNWKTSKSLGLRWSGRVGNSKVSRGRVLRKSLGSSSLLPPLPHIQAPPYLAQRPSQRLPQLLFQERPTSKIRRETSVACTRVPPAAHGDRVGKRRAVARRRWLLIRRVRGLGLHLVLLRPLLRHGQLRSRRRARAASEVRERDSARRARLPTACERQSLSIPRESG